MEAIQTTDEEFVKSALALLGRELGAGGLARFLRTYRPGSGNYMEDRHSWLKDVTVEELAGDVQVGNAKARAA